MSAKIVKLNPIAARIEATFAKSKDSEFLPAALEILETPPSPQRIAMIWIVCAMMSAALLWSCLAFLDIHAVAPGRIQPSGRSKVVQPFDTGKVKAVLVSNGSQVKAGEMLVELDPTDALAERDALSRLVENFDAEIPRRRAAIAYVTSGGKTPAKFDVPASVTPAIKAREEVVLQADVAQYVATRESLLAQIEEKVALSTRLQSSITARERLAEVMRERSNMRSELVVRQAGTRAAWLDAQQMLEQELVNLAYDKGQLKEAATTKVTLERRYEQYTRQFIAEQSQKLIEAERERDRRMQELLKADYKLARTRLTAPIDGTVQQFSVTTVGQVLTTGQAIAVIVPDGDKIEVEALVPNRDVGFIRVGQEAVVKIDAFPFTRFGAVNGRVVRVSRDSVDSREAMGGDASTVRNQNSNALSATPKSLDLVYPVTIELDRSAIKVDGKQVPLAPGMTVSAEIHTGERRVITYVLSPLQEILSETARER
jgi:hemolysin D